MSEEKIVNVREIVEERKVALKCEIDALKKKNIFPKLAVIIANEDEASKSYVKNKKRLCEELGVLYDDYFLKEEVKNEDLEKLIRSLNNDPTVHGILLQLPIYSHLNSKKILDVIDPQKDVDGFTSTNLGKLFSGNEYVVPCTPKGIITILESIGETFVGKHAVVVGRSNIVGKPVAQLLLNKNCTVTICHSKTKDLIRYTKSADILIAAVGKPHFITEDMIKEGATVIDVGINRVNGKLIGDVDTQNVMKAAKFVTKVPGGVGLTTVFSLLENVVKIAKNLEEN